MFIEYIQMISKCLYIFDINNKYTNTELFFVVSLSVSSYTPSWMEWLDTCSCRWWIHRLRKNYTHMLFTAWRLINTFFWFFFVFVCHSFWIVSNAQIRIWSFITVQHRPISVCVDGFHPFRINVSIMLCFALILHQSNVETFWIDLGENQCRNSVLLIILFAGICRNQSAKLI